jgi:hypothetical protein
MNASPQASGFAASRPPKGAQASLGAARREASMSSPQASGFAASRPPKGAQASLGAARREA